MNLSDMTCPHCGARLTVNPEHKNATCEYCGAAMLIDQEVQHVQFDNTEEAGYKFEKGRQRAMTEARGGFQGTSQQYSQLSKKKRKTWLWVLGWVCIFPLPLTILLLRKNNMKPILKYSFIAAAWAVYLIIGLAGAGDDSQKTTTNQTTTPNASESIQAEKTDTQDSIGSTDHSELEVLDDTTVCTDAVDVVAESVPAEPVEMNSLLELFASLNMNTTREQVDAFIAENEMVKYAFTHDSAYYIGYEKAAVRKRGRDREGEAVDIDFVTSGDINKLGMVKSAQYTIHSGSSSYTPLKFVDGVFYFEGEASNSGIDAVQKYLAANQQ